VKVLNLYAGIGGNRKLWNGVDCTAVEIKPEIAKIYQDFFPNDRVIVGDAHQYLLEHFKEFDFIWSSPPCKTHSQMRYRVMVLNGKTNPVYPDMSLYQEIIFLKYSFNSKWVVENTESYYEPLITPQFIQRHFFWSNFVINNNTIFPSDNMKRATKEELAATYGFDLDKIKTQHQREILRNVVRPELGKYVFDCAFKLQQQKLNEVK
jgi:DNA (cytosine-5)-methyltransferase 1